MLHRFPKSLAFHAALTLLLVGAPSAGHARGKSPARAAVLSLVLPGLGELYAGGPRSARFFLVTEGILWTGMATFRFLETYRIDAYHAHAAAHAGIRLHNLPESVIKEVGDFESIYERNQRERSPRANMRICGPNPPATSGSGTPKPPASNFRICAARPLPLNRRLSCLLAALFSTASRVY